MASPAPAKQKKEKKAKESAQAETFNGGSAVRPQTAKPAGLKIQT